MKVVVYAFLKDGAVYRDRSSFEEGDRLGRYTIIHDGAERRAQTDLIGGRRYCSLWLWDEEAEAKGKGFGIVPLHSI